MAAGGHYDPANTGKHLGPQGEGHKGDMPVLTVEANGKATKAVTAPHLTVADVKGHSIMIHAGGDNYSDQPAPLGGGGARLACDCRRLQQDRGIRRSATTKPRCCPSIRERTPPRYGTTAPGRRSIEAGLREVSALSCDKISDC